MEKHDENQDSSSITFKIPNEIHIPKNLPFFLFGLIVPYWHKYSPETCRVIYGSAVVLFLPYKIIEGYVKGGSRLSVLIWTFLGTATIGPAAVTAVQTVLSQILAKLFFGAEADDYFTEFMRTDLDGISQAEKEHRADMVFRWQYFAFLLVFCLGVAGLVEETMKYLAVALARRMNGGVLKEQEYLEIAVVATLGFSSVENIGFIYTARHESLRMLVLTVGERMLIGATAHGLSGCLIACKMIRRDVRGEALHLWQVIGAAVGYHGLFDFAMFAISAAHGNVGWIHPKEAASLAVMFSAAIGVMVLAVLHIRREDGTLSLRQVLAGTALFGK